MVSSLAQKSTAAATAADIIKQYQQVQTNKTNDNLLVHFFFNLICITKYLNISVSLTIVCPLQLNICMYLNVYQNYRHLCA